MILIALISFAQLAYYQWETGIPFKEIVEPDKIYIIKALYSPYHEMDIKHFCEALREMYLTRNKDTSLKRLRNSKKKIDKLA